MSDTVPNYQKYSLKELRDVLSHIDREKYPERVKLVRRAIQKIPASEFEQEKKNGMSKPEITVFLLIEILVWSIVIIGGASYF